MTRFGLLVPFLLIAACSRAKDRRGQIEVSWTGADSGSLNVPAAAQWCPADSALEISGIEGDSGAAVAIFPVDSIRPGVYPAGAPGLGTARPRAGVALRRFGENLILGYYSMSGTVTVDSGSPLRGSLQATLKGVNTGDQVTIAGSFRGLVIESGGAMCRDTLGGNAADTMVR
jgi:hypothetical protein